MNLDLNFFDFKIHLLSVINFNEQRCGIFDEHVKNDSVIKITMVELYLISMSLPHKHIKVWMVDERLTTL